MVSTKTLNTAPRRQFWSTGYGHTITFSNGGLDIDTTSGTGFTATGGGTVSVKRHGEHADTTTGTALDVEDTTIGGSDLMFQSISASGGGHGIVLVNTGSSGRLSVTGTGSAGSGGSITGITGADVATNRCGDLGSSSPPASAST